jgi:hypothetical protein
MVLNTLHGYWLLGVSRQTSLRGFYTTASHDFDISQSAITHKLSTSVERKAHFFHLCVSLQ